MPYPCNPWNPWITFFLLLLAVTGAAQDFDLLIVNGKLVVDGNRHTGATPGKVLRGPG